MLCYIMDAPTTGVNGRNPYIDRWTERISRKWTERGKWMMDGVGGGLRHNKEQKSGVAYHVLHHISKGVNGTLVRGGVLVQGIGWCTRWSV